MPVPYHFFSLTTTTLILILTLLQYLHPASSQSTPQYPSYNFTYPIDPDHSDSGIQVSYKDTIDVSWTANGSQNAPVLQIQCWNRNDSSGFIYYQHPPSYTHNVTTSPGPSLSDFLLSLSSYRQYSPCDLQLLDPHTEGSESATSIAIFITQYTNASTLGVTWSAVETAPKVAVDAGVATAASGSVGMNHIGVVGGMWAFVAATALATVLL